MVRVHMAVAAAAMTAVLLVGGCKGRHEGAGTIAGGRLPEAVVQSRAAKQKEAATALAPDAGAKQILFGDLHVHTTFSPDAFIRSLPMLQGEGAHPPADACDFARFCSGLDFWSINDHAEGISPEHWRETKESIRQCNKLAGDPKNPDTVAFLGWEWTQVGMTAADHYGHKNVILRDLEEDRVPKRPISAMSKRLVGALRQKLPLWQRLRFPILDWQNRQRYYDFGRYQEELIESPMCPEGVDSKQLPDTCQESASTPKVLFEKLAQLGVESMVIPHGTTWGFYTPADNSFDKQLKENDPRQGLIEIYSGHGNSEEYRDWRPVGVDAQGNLTCPNPTKSYLPCCWQAGEIIRSRCGNIPAEECNTRVAKARELYMKAGLAGHLTVSGAKIEEWKDCGQCRDCILPSFNYRPANSVQYAMAISNFDDPSQPRNFRFGFMASSDNHSARPGTGFKEFRRKQMTEVAGTVDENWRMRLGGAAFNRPVKDEAQEFDQDKSEIQPFLFLELERQASFFMTGGLVAVHSPGRDRDSIWNALKKREVYGTSGPRILLWFDLLNGPSGALPMGSETALGEAPRFRARAVGSFKQKPGCPETSTSALTPDRLDYLCRGECYNPTDDRYRITKIDVVRIRPQQAKGEPIGPLIQDPWKSFDCPDTQAGCEITFEDPEFVAGQREFLYYVRAAQEETMAVNAGGLRCTYNERGDCVSVKPCFGDYRTPADDDCLSPTQERAWSSPIFVKPAA